MKIKENVLEVLRNATFTEPSSIQLNGDLDRKLYTETNKVLESLGLKWNRKLKLHISDEDVEDKWYNLLSTSDRQLLAEQFARETKDEFDLGNYTEK
jgi:hypothetical protein